MMTRNGLSISEFTQSPQAATAKLIVAMNPDLEYVSEAKESGRLTIKVKSSGETVSLSYKDIAEGKLTMTDSTGAEMNVESRDGTGRITVKNKDGTTVIGGDATQAPPAWVPLHPSLSAMSGGVRTETATKLKGTYLTESTTGMSEMKTFYEEKLTAIAFKTKLTSSSADSCIIAGTSPDGVSSLTVMISSSDGKGCTVMLNYDGPR